MQLKLNGTAVAACGDDLKQTMEAVGYVFPCGGKGLCGKCRIRAAELPVTARDRRFFTEKDLTEGYRLACDKKVVDGLGIAVLFDKNAAVKKLEECDIVAILGDQTIYIGIINDGLVDSVVLENTREGGELKPAEKTKAVRSVIAHEAIEFFERYGVAKAGTIFVLATEAMYLALTARSSVVPDAETVAASMFDLPSDEVYLAPGGDSIAHLLSLDIPEKTLAERAVRLATDVRFRFGL